LYLSPFPVLQRVFASKRQAKIVFNVLFYLYALLVRTAVEDLELWVLMVLLVLMGSRWLTEWCDDVFFDP
jgi:hypothetical protein